VSSMEPSEHVRRGLSSSQCIANTGKTVAAATAAVPGVEDRKAVAPSADGAEAQLTIQGYNKPICR